MTEPVALLTACGSIDNLYKCLPMLLLVNVYPQNEVFLYTTAISISTRERERETERDRERETQRERETEIVCVYVRASVRAHALHTCITITLTKTQCNNAHTTDVFKIIHTYYLQHAAYQQHESTQRPSLHPQLATAVRSKLRLCWVQRFYESSQNQSR